MSRHFTLEELHEVYRGRAEGRGRPVGIGLIAEAADLSRPIFLIDEKSIAGKIVPHHFSFVAEIC